MMDIFNGFFNSNKKINDENNKELNSESDKEFDSESDKEFNVKYDEDCLDNYFVGNKIPKSNGFVTDVLWTGFKDENINRTYVNRTLNRKHGKKIRINMEKDYKKNKCFKLHDQIHLAKVNDKYYLIDEPHRYAAYKSLIRKNNHPVQKILCIINYCKDKEKMYDLVNSVNDRLIVKKEDFKKEDYKKYKKNNIIYELDKKYEDINIWGSNRPRMNKNKFIEKIQNNNSIENMTLEKIIEKIDKYNDSVRVTDRENRTKQNISVKNHEFCEKNNFFLGYDKNINWIDNLGK